VASGDAALRAADSDSCPLLGSSTVRARPASTGCVLTTTAAAAAAAAVGEVCAGYALNDRPRGCSVTGYVMKRTTPGKMQVFAQIDRRAVVSSSINLMAVRLLDGVMVMTQSR